MGKVGARPGDSQKDFDRHNGEPEKEKGGRTRMENKTKGET